MAALQENGVLKTLTNFFATQGGKVQELYLVDSPTDGVVKLQIDFFPGRSGGFNRFGRMGQPLRNLNVLVIKNVEVQTKGNNLVEKAAVALLSDLSNVDAIVLEDILDPAWKTRLISGDTSGRRKWLPSPIPDQDNVYLTRDQVQSDFLGGKSKRKRHSKKRKSRRK
jgi:hypothetical protein